MKWSAFIIHLSFFCLLIAAPLNAQIEPPNYNFSLDSLAVFYPGQKLDTMTEKHGEGELMEKKGKTTLYKFYVAHIRYKFPVFVQINQDNTAVDFFARLPTYFLHNIFHQSLINRYGNQQKYFLQENNAVYKWTDLENFTLTYSGTCTITCFPIYFAGSARELPNGHKSLLEKMKL
jgi:hypothetical protein